MYIFFSLPVRPLCLRLPTGLFLFLFFVLAFESGSLSKNSFRLFFLCVRSVFAFAAFFYVYLLFLAARASSLARSCVSPGNYGGGWLSDFLLSSSSFFLLSSSFVSTCVCVCVLVRACVSPLPSVRNRVLCSKKESSSARRFVGFATRRFCLLVAPPSFVLRPFPTLARSS